MKKIHFWLLVSLFVGAFVVVGCGDDEPTPSNPTQTDSTDVDPTDTTAIDTTETDTTEADTTPVSRVVKIVYDGTTATVDIPAVWADGIEVAQDGAHVTITNNIDSVETTFELSGSSSNGSFTYNGTYKWTLELAGLSLTSQQGAALDVKCGKRMALVLEEGTENTLADYSGGSQKACLYCKGHMEVAGSGTLNVTGNLTHAIKTKEYLQIKKSAGTINVLAAAGDALNVGQYYLQQGGEVNITNTTKGDGIQVDYVTLDDDVTPDPDKEENGKIFIKGGKINIEVANEDKKAIKSDEMVTISGGTLSITASGNGSRGIQTDTDVLINQEDATTSITINVTGGVCTVEEDSDDPHRAMGIKADGAVTINAGTVNIQATGKKSRTIRCLTYYASGEANVTLSAQPKVGQ